MRLADEIAALVAAESQGDAEGVTLAEACRRLGCTRSDGESAVASLLDDGVIRRLRIDGAQGYKLVRADWARSGWRICAECALLFVPPILSGGKISPRVTCSRSCSMSMSWRGDEARAKRSASIRKALNQPEQRKRIVERNLKAWESEERRAALSRWNRERWSDVATKIELSVAISQRFARRPQDRAAIAELRRKEWADPVKRAERIKRQKESKSSPEYRARAGAAMRRRWRDPEQREAFLIGRRERDKSPEYRARHSEIRRQWWKRKKEGETS